jgi:hypothetical protein
MAMSEQKMLALRDGICVPVRGIRAEDAGALQRLVGRSSDRSVELRFFGHLKELSDEMVGRFADVDGRDQFALVALDPDDTGEIVGVVRYARRGTTGPSMRRSSRTGYRVRGLGSG